MDKTVTDFLLTVRPIKIVPEKRNITDVIKSVYNLLNPELNNKDIKFLLNLKK